MQWTKAASLTTNEEAPRGTEQVFNNQGAVIPRYSPVAWDVSVAGAGGVGRYVKIPATANLALLAGIAQDTIGTGSRGTIITWGLSTARAWGIAAWSAAAHMVISDGKDYFTFGTTANQVGQTISIAENSSAATTEIACFVKAM